MTLNYLKDSNFQFSTEEGSQIAKVSAKYLTGPIYEINGNYAWNAIVMWSHKLNRAVAVHSQVINLRQATKMVKQLLSESIPY